MVVVVRDGQVVVLFVFVLRRRRRLVVAEVDVVRAHRRHGLHGDDRGPVLGSDGPSDGAAI